MSEGYRRQAAYYCSWSFPGHSDGPATATVRFQDEDDNWSLLEVVAKGRGAGLGGRRYEQCCRRMARLILEREAGGPVDVAAVDALVSQPGSSLHRVTVAQVGAHLEGLAEQMLLDMTAVCSAT